MPAPTVFFEELEGQRLDGYELEQFLGSGAEGVVFKANNTLGTKYALKIFGLRDELVGAETALKEAKRQAAVEHPSVAQVSSPGIGPLLVGGVERRVLYIPSPFAPLGNAEDSPPFVACQIGAPEIETLQGLTDGLAAIHSAGLVHNDIKPANILQFREKAFPQERTVLKITDFGMAGVANALGISKVYGLTHAFMAPEQISGASVASSDIYSLGATFFYLLTGRNPIELVFENQDELSAYENNQLNRGEFWARAHTVSPRPDAQMLNPRCPTRLALLIMQMMAVDATARPSLKKCLDCLDKVRRDVDARSAGYSIPADLRDHLGQADKGIRFVSPSPAFRPEVYRSTGRQFAILRASIAPNTTIQYARLLQLLFKKLGGSFWMHETYGSTDIHAMLWATPDDLIAIESELPTEFPNADIRCQRATRIEHFHWSSSSNVVVSPVQALAIQEEELLYGLEPDDYCGQPVSIDGKNVGAFMYIQSNAFGRAQVDRPATTRQVRMALRDLWSTERFKELTLVEFGSHAATAMMMVRCVAMTFEDLTLLASIVGEFTTPVSTETFPETSRFCVSMGQIQFD